MKRLEKEEASYPWAPTEEELHAMIAKSELDFANGNYTTQEDLIDKLKNKLAYPCVLTKEELEASVQQAREDVRYERCISDEQLTSYLQTMEEDKFSTTVSEPEVAYCDGKHTEVSYPWAPTDEELRASVQKAYQEAQDGKCISHEEMKASIASWLL